MHISEAALDTPRDQVATRYLELTDTLGRVSFVRGVAQGPMSLREAERLRGLLGPDFQIVGPWTEPGTSPAPDAVADPHPPIDSSQPSAPACASEPTDSPLRATTRRLRRTP